MRSPSITASEAIEHDLLVVADHQVNGGNQRGFGGHDQEILLKPVRLAVQEAVAQSALAGIWLRLLGRLPSLPVLCFSGRSVPLRLHDARL
jgi:hypothetical protein